MKERFGEFYRSHIRNKITKAKTVLGQTTADNIASQLDGSTPVDIDSLLGESVQIPASKIDKYGELIEEDKNKQ